MSYNFIVPDSDYPESAPYIMISFMSRDVLKDVIKDCRETMSRTDVEKYDAFKIACDIVWTESIDWSAEDHIERFVEYFCVSNPTLMIE